MLLGYMKTLTLRPCNNVNTTTELAQNTKVPSRNPNIGRGGRSSSAAHHRLRRQVGLELGADDARVAVRAGDLAPDAAVVGAAALGLGLVDVRHPLAAVPRDVLLGVHPLDLHQRRVLVLVRLGPASTTARHRPVSRSAVEEQAGGDRLEWGRGNSPLVSEDGAPDVEPHALPSAPLHHLAVAAGAESFGGGVLGMGGDGATTKGRNPSRRR